MTLSNNIGIERISEFSKKFSVISTHLGYKKFSTDKPKILFFNGAGWIAPEVVNALKINEYPFESINVAHLDPDNKKLTLDDYLHFHKELIKKLIEFKPDCILTINHAAFDSIGLLSKILEQFKIPFVSWFVDSPLYIFKNADPQKSPYLYLFSWERSYVTRLKEMDFNNVFYLPLASDYKRFEGINVSSEEKNRYGCDVAFVGNSNKDNTKNWLNKEYSAPKISAITEEAVELQIKNPEIEMRLILKELDTSKLLDKFDEEMQLHYEAFCILKTTEIFRNRVVKVLSENFNLKIFGDEGWKVEYSKNYCGPIDYYKELPKLYKSAKVIVNVTSFQMNTAVNQRVYDVFLSAGFLVSDFRSDYDLLFGRGTIPTYQNDEEMIKVVDFYLKHDSDRLKISKKINSMIKDKHLYSMRIKELFSTVKKNYHEKN